MIPNLNEGATKAAAPPRIWNHRPAFIVPIDDDEARWRNCTDAGRVLRINPTMRSSSSSWVSTEPPTACERQRAHDLAGMAAEVSDELLDHFVVTGPPNSPTRSGRYQGSRESRQLLRASLTNDPSALNAWADVAEGVTNP